MPPLQQEGRAAGAWSIDAATLGAQPPLVEHLQGVPKRPAYALAKCLGQGYRV